MTQTPQNPSSGVATRELVERLRSQDPTAGRILSDQFRAPLIRFCWGYLHEIQESEDAVQDVFLHILSAANIPEAFRPWLYRIARNQCLNLLRARARQPAGAAVSSQIDAALTGPLTGLVRSEVREQISELLGRLHEDHREVLRLRYVEDLSREEIAEVLGLAEPLVKSRLYEAVRRLRELGGTEVGE